MHHAVQRPVFSCKTSQRSLLTFAPFAASATASATASTMLFILVPSIATHAAATASGAAFTARRRSRGCDAATAFVLVHPAVIATGSLFLRHVIRLATDVGRPIGFRLMQITVVSATARAKETAVVGKNGKRGR